MNSLANYQIKHPIGRGAGSFVCKIVNRTSKCEYAAKIVQRTNQNAQKIENEINIHKSLQHRNIVQLVETLQDADNHYIIMELCDQEFYQLVKKSPFTESEIRHYGKQLAEGLKYLHDQNIIHRDLKLGNLLILGSTLKIADFGLAVKLTDEEEERSTLCGTPNYISPEILNQQPYGKKVDLWSMGCCLYSMCTGKGPFEDAALGDVLRKVKLGEFELPKHISAHFKDLLLNLINLDVGQRYSIDQIIKHPFFKDEVPQKQRNQSSSQIKQLLEFSPFVKQSHRQTNSMVNLDKQQALSTFLQRQQAIGGKKLLFGLTTIGKQPQKKDIDMEQMPRFFLGDDNKQDKENVKPQQQKAQFMESPLKTVDLKPCKLQTKNGQLQIHDDGKFEMEITNKQLIFIIDQNGQQVIVQKKGQKVKNIPLRDLSPKLQRFYMYSKQVCGAIRERNTKQKFTNEHGSFAIKNLKQGLCFEAFISQSKLKVQHFVSSQQIKLQLQNGTFKTVTMDEFQQNQQKMEPNEVYTIKIALKYLAQCLKSQ